MIDRFDGDVALQLTIDGGTIEYHSGQPVMDAGGLETAVNISLFSRNGWHGNALEENNSIGQIGSDFELTVRPNAITAQVLRNINQSAEDALRWMTDISLAESVTVSSSTPELNIVNINILIVKPDSTSVNISYELNWVAGFLNPVNAKVS